MENFFEGYLVEMCKEFLKINLLKVFTLDDSFIIFYLSYDTKIATIFV